MSFLWTRHFYTRFLSTFRTSLLKCHCTPRNGMTHSIIVLTDAVQWLWKRNQGPEGTEHTQLSEGSHPRPGLDAAVRNRNLESAGVVILIWGQVCWVFWGVIPYRRGVLKGEARKPAQWNVGYFVVLEPSLSSGYADGNGTELRLEEAHSSCKCRGFRVK